MVKNADKTTEVYNKETLIRRAAEACDKDIKVVREIYNAIEDDVFALLATADEDTDVRIKLFEGVSLVCGFVPESTKMNNLTGKTAVVPAKIKPKAVITRNYCDKLNA